jgi:peroxiredoxin
VADTYLDAGDEDGARLAFQRMREMGQGNEAVLDMAARKERALDRLGEAAPAVAGTALDGTKVSLADLAGRVVLIDFWATWCEPYTQELHHLVDAYERFHERGFEVIGVCLDRDIDRDRLGRFTANRGMAWPQLFDGQAWDGELARAFGVDALPSSVLVDAQGRIHRIDLRGRELHRALAALLP